MALLPGPWEHHYLAANGARFHVAIAGPEDGTPVILLHGFPQFWWEWRHQLVDLAAGGYRAIAMDLRGYGASDKTPRGYDPFTLAGDVAGVIGALGVPRAHLVGHGWGGYVGWATALLHPAQVSSLVAVAAPHPRTMLSSFWRGGPAIRHLAAMQLPWFPERRLRAGKGTLLVDHLRAWAAPGSAWPTAEEVEVYQSALALWPAPHCALEYHRWLFRSRFRDDGRRFGRALRTPVSRPCLTLFGELDPVVRLPDHSGRHVSAEYASRVLPGVGHFAPEEAPDQVNAALRKWLAAG